MDEPLLTIGAFARAVGLTTSALRHYDDCGLLVPADVDLATGYRYYTPDLARRARLIVGMREAGVPIETMRTVLDGPASEASRALRAFLDDQAARRERTAVALGEVLAAVEAGAEPVVPGSVSVAAPELAAALRQVRPAADGDPTSPLSSVLVDLGEGTVDVVATNRYWMTVRTLTAATSGSGRAALSLPEADELARLLDELDEAQLEVSDGRVTAGGLAWGRDVAYPAHRIVLAGVPAPGVRAVISRTDVVAAVDKAGRAEVELAVGPDRVHAGPERYDVGALVAGRPVSLLMGAALLRRAVAACLGPELLLEAVAPDRPVVLRSGYQPGFRALVMPIALR